MEELSRARTDRPVGNLPQRIAAKAAGSESRTSPRKSSKAHEQYEDPGHGSAARLQKAHDPVLASRRERKRVGAPPRPKFHHLTAAAQTGSQ
jgi:hypothetical protein